MWRTTVKGLLAHKLRLASTFVAVMLGVSFVAGTFVIGDTIQSTFDNLFGEVNRGIDVVVRSHAAFSPSDHHGGGPASDREDVPASVLAAIRRLPGVRAAEGTVQGYAQFVDKHGKAIAPQAPTFGVSWHDDPGLSALRLRSGRRPSGPGEVAVDAATARKYGFRSGDRVKVLLRGPAREMRVSGIAGFGDADNIAGATLAAFDTATAQDVLGHPGGFNQIDVAAADGTSPAELRAAIEQVLPPRTEVVTGDSAASENADAIKQGLGFFTTFLLVFAYIALFVGSFIIFNTFSIIVAQRIREMALLRALGASRRQVTVSVLGEALAVGVAASLTGVVVGVLVAKGLTALLGAIGLDLPGGGTVFKGRTLVVSLITGVVVTGAAAIVPARRAGKVAPVEAMREGLAETVRSLHRRVATGTATLVAGAALLGTGLFADVRNGLPLVGLGAMVAFVGVALVSPVLARPLSRVMGAPLPRLFGMPGRLARENAMRNPRRTAATASALMVGVGLVATVAVLAASIRASVDAVIAGSLRADYVLTTGNFAGFSPALGEALAGQPAIAAASGIRLGEFEIDGARKQVEAVDPASVGQLMAVDVKAGTLDSLARGAVLVDAGELKAKGWAVGEHVPVAYARTGPSTVVIGGTYATNQFLGKYVVSTATFEANFSSPLDFVVLVKAVPGKAAATKEAVQEAHRAFPNVTAKTKSEYRDEQKKQVDQLLTLVYALLLLAIVIAVIGIMNTMALSVFERTREIGLVRAVGMSRRQLRRTIRWESVLVSVLGALIGIAVGVGFGAALVRALQDQGIVAFRLPVGTLVAFVAIAALAGMAAAIAPARRAARLDVLTAIATT